MLKRTVLTLMLVLGFALAKAQTQQEDKLSYTVDYGKSKATDTRFVQNSIKLRMPIKTGKKGHFILGGEVGILKVSHSLTPADSSTLKTIGLIVGYQTILTNRARLSLTAEPILAADLNNLSGQDFRFRSDINYLLPPGKKFTFGFGLVYQYQFSGSQLLPVVIPIWHISDKVTLSGAFPLIPRLEVKLDQRWSIGAGINGGYSLYRLSAFNNQYIQIQNWSFGFTPKYRTSSHFELSGFLGFGNRTISVFNSDQTIPLRIYSWDIGGGSRVATSEQKFKGLALNLTAAYRFE